MRGRAGRGLLIQVVAAGGWVAGAWGAPADTASVFTDSPGPAPADTLDAVLESADTLGAGPASTGPFRSAMGVVIGLPQIIGVTWETEPLYPFRFQANLGSVLVIWSANARLLLIPSHWSVQPYGFVGWGAFFGVQMDDFDGFSGYTWMGYGARIRISRILVYGEMTFFWEDEVEGSPGLAAGVLWEY